MAEVTTSLQVLTRAKRSESHLLAHYAITLGLAESASLQEAAPAFLQSIGESLGWQLTLFWKVEEQTSALQFVSLWHHSTVDASGFIADSRDYPVQHEG